MQPSRCGRPETGERYTVKRYESEKAPAEGSWRHATIRLKPNKLEFAPIERSGADEGHCNQMLARVDSRPAGRCLFLPSGKTWVP